MTSSSSSSIKTILIERARDGDSIMAVRRGELRRSSQARGRTGAPRADQVLRPGDDEARAAPLLRFDPDGAPHALGDLLDDGEADAGVLGPIARLERREDVEDALVESRRDPGAVVRDREF